MPLTTMGHPIDQRTEALGLPLPHIDNWHEDDVPRLREAIAAIDLACASLAAILATKADGGSMTAAVSALQAAVIGLEGAVESMSSEKVGSVNGQPGPSVTLTPEHLALGPANGATAMSVERDGQGRVWRITSTVGGAQALQTIDYAAGGGVQTITTTYKGRTRVETYTYEDGRFAGMTAEETQI